MEIILKDLLNDINYLNVGDNIKINMEQNQVIFGANGIGKTTIYYKLKDQHTEYDYLDYGETKDLFKKNKKKIEVSLGINRLEELEEEIKGYEEILSSKNRMKQKGIKTNAAASEISNKVWQKFKNDEELSKIEISDEEFKGIKKIDNYLVFILSNFAGLKSINDIGDELKLVDKNYLKKALSLIEPKVSEGIQKCPICDTPIDNLKDIIQRKIDALAKINNEYLKKFIDEFDNIIDDEDIREDFKKVLESVLNIEEEKFVDYFIVDGNLENIKNINEAITHKDNAIKELNNCLTRQQELFDSLISQKEMYTDYLKDNFKANVQFDNEKKIVTISFDRNVDTFSTGEINIILFITKLFGFLGSEKTLLIIDDPISSYDLVNQYHIAYHLCKIINNDGKNVIMFTHNPDVVNIINSQYRKGYKYYFLDKVDENIIMNTLPKDMEKGANVLAIDNLINDTAIESNKYISLMTKRDEEDPKCKLSSILHYDSNKKIVYLDEDCNEFEGCTNKYFIDYIEHEKYLENLKNTDFKELCKSKIISMTSIRVWIEYKLASISCSELKGTFSEKVNKFFNENKNIQERYPKLTKEQLMSKKVMLNQNCHLKSQVMPFYYVLSTKADDVKKEIEDIKSMFVN